MIVAATCWSTGGILVRQLSITNPWEIVFWRSLFMTLFVVGVLLVMHGRAMPKAIRAA
jgi:drug/metabolite transporter (DMT)-like permease